MTYQSSVFAQTTLFDRQVAWLHKVVSEAQLLADLAFADILVWAPTQGGSFVAVSHLRPSSAATLFYRDVVETDIRPEWLPLVQKAFSHGRIVDSRSTAAMGEARTRVRAVPIRAKDATASSSGEEPVIAVMTRHSNMSESRVPSRQQLTFDECANHLFAMIAEGLFPDSDAPSAPAQGAPRASDGLIKLDVEAKVSFASPNALSAFRRMGFREELEGTELLGVTATLMGADTIVEETLPLVLTGRAPWRSDIESQGVTVALRAIPLRRASEWYGAIVLSRDVTQVRLREKEMITKDATIREIHHRVKNNLQTVASLLRVQTRRTHSEVVKEALGQAMRRVEAIAVVHDTLSEGLSQSVDFDTVLERVLMSVAEVASPSSPVIRPTTTGSVGILPSEYATPLALVLTELVTNSVQHGLRGKKDGQVEIESIRQDGLLTISVRDNGGGLLHGKVGDGLGTQIVRTLVDGELGGSIKWHPKNSGGTEVRILIPMMFLQSPNTTDSGPPADPNEDKSATVVR